MEIQAPFREIAPTRPEPDSVREHLACVLDSAQFSGSVRLSRFLQYCVESALEGAPGRLKEYDIAVSVFDRPSSFDPRLDPIVRVQALRLRGKLKEYYHEDGSQERLRIFVPKGGYMACFEHVETRLPPPTVSPSDSFALEPDVTTACPEPGTGAGHRLAAVTELRNLSASEGPSWLESALRTMLTAELGQGVRIQIVPEGDVARLMTDVSLPDSGGFHTGTLERMRTGLGADLVLTGSYLAIGGKIRLDLRLQETRSGKTLALLSRMADESNLLELVSTVGKGIRAKLSAEVSESEQPSFREAAAATDSDD